MANTTTTTTTTTIETYPEFSLSRAIALQAAAEGVLRGEEDWSPEELNDLVTYLAEDTMREEWTSYDFKDVLGLDAWHAGEVGYSAQLNKEALASLL
tara:strand:+ start:151 stop:441 length:291 start_codon:yes stop_codon:yes gene_type:complete